MFNLLFNNVQHFTLFPVDMIDTYIITVFHPWRYQRYSTTYSPHNSERQRERQRGLVKQTFELDEAAAAERQDDQVADDDVQRTPYLKHCVTIQSI